MLFIIDPHGVTHGVTR